MKREELDIRPRDVIMDFLDTIPDDVGGAYCGDHPMSLARDLFRYLRSNGMGVVYMSTYVLAGEDEPRVLRDLMARFRRPKYQERDVYHRGFAERIIDEIYAAGLEIRT